MPRFKLRSLLLIFPLIGIALGWTGLKIRERMIDQYRLQILQQYGAHVFAADGDIYRGGPVKSMVFVTVVHLDQLTALSEEFPELEALRFGMTDLVDEQFVTLKLPPELRKLWLDETPISDASLEHLANAASLEDLTLFRTRVTDDGLEHLAALTNLRELDLTETNVSDEGLRHLSKLTRLEALSLDRTNVTAKGLEHLLALKSLRRLRLPDGIEDEDTVALREALPNCRVDD